MGRKITEAAPWLRLDAQQNCQMRRADRTRPQSRVPLDGSTTLSETNDGFIQQLQSIPQSQLQLPPSLAYKPSFRPKNSGNPNQRLSDRRAGTTATVTHSQTAYEMHISPVTRAENQGARKRCESMQPMVSGEDDVEVEVQIQRDEQRPNHRRHQQRIQNRRRCLAALQRFNIHRD